MRENCLEKAVRGTNNHSPSRMGGPLLSPVLRDAVSRQCPIPHLHMAKLSSGITVKSGWPLLHSGQPSPQAGWPDFMLTLAVRLRPHLGKHLSAGSR